MIITGIVAEYNPFHNGHGYHLDESVKLTNPDLIIAIMSGNFVQRGEPAILDKWTRTKMALLNGVDLVVELPTIYATSSSDNFAYGSILALKAINANNFVFGSETNNIKELWEIAKISNNEPSIFKAEIKKFLNEGFSYPEAFHKAFIKLYPDLQTHLTESNNILGISYLKSLIKLSLDTKPLSIKRIDNKYHDKEIKSISSATAIRNKISNLKVIETAMPNISFSVIKNKVNKKEFICLKDFEDIIFYLIKSASLDELSNLPEIEVGMPELLKNNIFQVDNIKDFINSCTSKRYPSSRIQRLLIRILLQISTDLYEKSLIQENLPYIRVLGMNINKSKKIKEWQSKVRVPIIQKTANYEPKDSFSKLSWELDLKATDIYFNTKKLRTTYFDRQDFVYPIEIKK
jgi:predicted nucleotidyltransferase